MGIYRQISVTDAAGRPTTLEYAQSREVTIHVSEPGLEYTATLKPGDWTETRTDCFCCSCGDYGSDPACRNHGFAAERPCEKHGTSGSVWDDMFNDDGTLHATSGTMPESVQAEALRRRGDSS